MDQALKTIRVSDLPEALMEFKSDGIVHVTFKKNCVLDIELQMRMLAKYHWLTNSEPTPFIFESEEGLTVTKEARDNAIIIEEQSPCKAMAVVVENLAYKIIANFYMTFNKPKRPYKVFSNKKDALEWLKQFV